MNRLTLGTLVLAACLPAQNRLPAQEKLDARAALARAMVIEAQEQNLAAAIAEYRRLADDAKLPEEVRAEARLHLGLALLRAGDQAAGQAELGRVASLGGALGARALQAVQAAATQDQEMRDRVASAFSVLEIDGDRGSQELKFLGAPAAPELAAKLLAYPFVRELYTRTVAILLDLDPAVAARTLTALQARDVYVRRAAAASLRLTGHAEADAAVLRFLRDPDMDVRADAVRELARTAPLDLLQASLADADEGVRKQAFVKVAIGCDPPRAAELLPIVEQELAREHPTQALWTFMFSFWPKTEATVACATRALRHPECVVKNPKPAGELSLRPNECLDAALATAEALGAYEQRHERKQQLWFFVQSCEKSWDREGLAKRLRLRSLGFGNVENWLAGNGTAADLPAVLEHLDAFSLGWQGDMHKWLRNLDIHSEYWRAFADHATARARPFEGERDETERRGGPRRPSDPSDIVGATYLATRTWHPDAMAWVAEFVPTEARALAGADLAFDQATQLTEPARAALTAIAKAQTGDLWRTAATTGGTLLRTIAKHGVDDAADAFVQACAQGSAKTCFEVLKSSPRTSHVVALQDATIADIVARNLALGRADVFEVVAKWVDDDTAPVVYRAVCESALTAPVDSANPTLRRDVVRTVLFKGRVDPVAAERLYLAAMQDEDPEVGHAATDAISVTGNRLSADGAAALAAHVRTQPDEAAIRLLGRQPYPEHADVVRGLLAHADMPVRRAAAAALTTLIGTEATEDLLPLFADPSASVRRAVCSLAGSLLDRRFAPALLKLLRDPEGDVRTDAQKALEAIEYYVTQTERWQRLLQGTGLEANSAAEALLQQAKATSTKHVRLAAIRGLGALGVKEALPFLIQMMQEQDQEIAGAAAAAVDALSK